MGFHCHGDIQKWLVDFMEKPIYGGFTWGYPHDLGKPRVAGLGEKIIVTSWFNQWKSHMYWISPALSERMPELKAALRFSAWHKLEMSVEKSMVRSKLLCAGPRYYITGIWLCAFAFIDFELYCGFVDHFLFPIGFKI